MVNLGSPQKKDGPFAGGHLFFDQCGCCKLSAKWNTKRDTNYPIIKIRNTFFVG
jgi:hypothetical protein